MPARVQAWRPRSLDLFRVPTVLGHRRMRERGPAALADRAEARGSEKSERKLAVSAISEGESSFFRRQAHRVCGKQQHNNQTIPVAAGKPVGTSFKVQQFCGFAPEAVCLR